MRIYYGVVWEMCETCLPKGECDNLLSKPIEAFVGCSGILADLCGAEKFYAFLHFQITKVIKTLILCAPFFYFFWPLLFF